MTHDQKRHLADQGFVLLEGFMGAGLLAGLRRRIGELFEEEGDRAGHEFRTEAHAHRLANLVDKGGVFQRAVAWPPLLACVREVLGPDIKLSSLNARSADPHADDSRIRWRRTPWRSSSPEGREASR